MSFSNAKKQPGTVMDADDGSSNDFNVHVFYLSVSDCDRAAGGARGGCDKEGKAGGGADGLQHAGRP